MKNVLILDNFRRDVIKNEVVPRCTALQSNVLRFPRNPVGMY